MFAVKQPIIVVIFVVSLATLIPRFIPYYINGLEKLPPFAKKCMKLLPIAALGALIFPYALTDFLTTDVWFAGLLGTAAAFFFGYRHSNMIVSILASVLVTYITLGVC